MNKQELIDELKRISLEKQHKALTHPESKNYYEGMVMAYSQVVHMVNTVLKLDEPQKPVVPKFFDDWAKIVLVNHDKFYAISLISRVGWGYGVNYELRNDGETEEKPELLGWLIKRIDGTYPNKKKAIEALLYGYEVEKEPLYEVVFHEDESDRYLLMELGEKCYEIAPESENDGYRSQWFTEREIKEIDERYWPFAVPAEEVAEG